MCGNRTSSLKITKKELTTEVVMPELESLESKVMLAGVVGASRFELETSCAQGRRATRLRYAPRPERIHCKAFCGLVHRDSAAVARNHLHQGEACAPGRDGNSEAAALDPAKVFVVNSLPRFSPASRGRALRRRSESRWARRSRT
jgi:hypothetical protein